MMKTVTWFAKCLFLYLVVVILAIRFAWVFALPVWSIATRFHWTQLSSFIYLLNYFLPIFAAAGFLLGLVPFERLGRALANLVPNIGGGRTSSASSDPDAEANIPVGLWAWVPVTVAFLIRYFTWQSRNSSVLGHDDTGRFARFFGTLRMQNPSLLDPKWASDRFVFTGPMLFLMAWAVAVLLRRTLARAR